MDRSVSRFRFGYVTGLISIHLLLAKELESSKLSLEIVLGEF